MQIHSSLLIPPPRSRAAEIDEVISFIGQGLGRLTPILILELNAIKASPMDTCWLLDLRVMDNTAIALCKNNIPILVFDLSVGVTSAER